MHEHRIVPRDPGSSAKAVTPRRRSLPRPGHLALGGCLALATVLLAACAPTGSGPGDAGGGSADGRGTPAALKDRLPIELARGVAEITVSGALDASVSMRLTAGGRFDESTGFHVTWADGNPGTSFLVIRGPAFVGSRWTSDRLVLAYQLLGLARGAHPHCRVHIERGAISHMTGGFVCPKEQGSGTDGPIRLEGTFTATP